MSAMVPESIFSQGQMPTLKEVLASREQRAFFEEEISKTNANQTLISLKCNIPGPVKYNAIVRQISEIGIQEIKNAIQANKWKITYEKLMDLDTGPEYFVVVDTYPTAVKQAAIMIEDGSLLGQLFTISVFYLEEGKMIEVQRMEIGYEPRKCMICGDEAFECENANVHSRDEIQKKIEAILREDGRVRLEQETMFIHRTQQIREIIGNN
eukprot:TRINITY_DN28277_c0_g1_i1.p2 TRINITY_DN28277_c0_g1~~TRINITY_DN28277_c0_g1_i1.p2  ORF type:complete len:210 (+),score=28.38 TRINITY_DN28277_c0_g1_i1:203-832(+)